MVVLEGNRRTTVYQMLLDRSLIPEKFQRRVPIASARLLGEIKKIPVDVVDDRKTAMAFLAARHIQGVKQWSSYSKWHVSYEMFQDGLSIDEITEQLPGSGDISRNIKSYKILLRVLNHPAWTPAERAKIDPLTLKPDQLIRLFFIRDTMPGLGLRYDDKYNLFSTKMPNEQLDDLLQILAREAFLDKTITTRTKYSDDVIHDIVAPFLATSTDDQTAKTSGENSESDRNQADGEEEKSASEAGFSEPHGIPMEPSSQERADATEPANEKRPRGSGKIPPPYFFEGLKIGHLNCNDGEAHGVIYVANELLEISKNRAVNKYPISSCFLTRAIIEHSLIYYAKKVKIQASDKMIYSRISRANGDPMVLSDIIDTYLRNLSDFIPNPTIRQYFEFLFRNNPKQEPLNWVIHRPQSFNLPADKLINLPSQGLRCVIEYLLACV